MEVNWLAEAIHNNAAWCDLIATSHGVVTQATNDVWVGADPMPPLYPNLITLAANVDLAGQIGRLDVDLAAGWGIKDSFKSLDIAHLGFHVAFPAHWYLRPGSKPWEQTRLAKGAGATIVRAVATPEQFVRWIDAWGETPVDTVIFKPALWQAETVEFLYCETDERIVAGLASNLSGYSLGISNLFGTASGISACIESLVRRHPRRALVGYGAAAEVSHLSEFGFSAMGELQVWLRG